MGIGRLGKRWPFLRPALALLLAPWLVGAAPGMTEVAIPAAPGRVDEATDRLVRSIFEYTRWPARPDPVRLCIVGATRHAARLGTGALLDGRRIDARAVPGDGYAALGGGRIITDGPTGQLVANDVMAYVEKLGTVKLAVEGRIKRLGQ